MGINDIRKGVAIILKSEPWVVTWFQNVKPGKGQAFVKTKLKNLKNGKVVDMTFRNSDSLEEANVEKTNAQFLYRQGDDLCFMDSSTFEQYSVASDLVGESAKFLKEEVKVIVLKLDGLAFSVEMPKKIDLKVIDSPPGEKGNTATNATKTIKLETGVEIDAPLFIKEGDVVRINPETGSYVERIS